MLPAGAVCAPSSRFIRSVATKANAFIADDLRYANRLALRSSSGNRSGAPAHIAGSTNPRLGL